MKEIKKVWNRLFQPKPEPTPKFTHQEILWDEYVMNEDTIQTLQKQVSILNKKNSDIHERRQDLYLRNQALERFIIEKFECNHVDLKHVSTGFSEFNRPMYRYEVNLINYKLRDETISS